MYKISFRDVFWGGDPWDPMGGTHGGVHGIPGWALGDPLAFRDPLALGDPWALGDP